MDPTLLGLVLDTSVLVAAERRGLTVERLLENVRSKAGELEIGVSTITLAEHIHGFHRATAEDVRQRRRTFIQDLKNAVPVHPITERTSEIIGRVGAEQAAKGITVPLGDLLIGASALEQGYGVGTGNLGISWKWRLSGDRCWASASGSRPAGSWRLSSRIWRSLRVRSDSGVQAGFSGGWSLLQRRAKWP